MDCFSITHAAAAAKSLQLCLTLCDPIDGSPPGSPFPGILQARILEWFAISFSRRSSWPRDWTQFSYTAGRFFTNWATREAPKNTGVCCRALLQRIFPIQGLNPGLPHWRLILYSLSHQGSPCLFNLHARNIMWNPGLDESQAGIKIAGRHTNNLRYEDDTTLMAKSEEELNSLLIKVKKESENAGLKLNI